MNAPESGEERSKPHQEKSEAGSPGLLGVAALVGLWFGAIGSVALMFRVGRRNDSTVLMVLFTGWVLSPFAGLAWAALRSRRWSQTRRKALAGLTLVLTMVSLAIYGKIAFSPPGRTPAAMFLFVPLLCWVALVVFFGTRKMFPPGNE